ncbi:MAG: hypothetical protein CME71_03110 [Halobacteriovorax sp.]|nr:hypothetical protein [Halobacteriovorax sp.]
MLEQSRLTGFIDQKSGFTLHYFEGQSVIRDLALIHDIKGEGFHFFRDAVLTFLPLISYLKSGESFGFYIDSKEPWFRFKIEANTQGYMRTLLFPESFDNFPKEINGNCRLTKILPGQREPYNTLVELDNLSITEVSNLILTSSYQVNARTYLSQSSDQSLLIQRLPDRQVDHIDPEERPSLDEFYAQTIKSLSPFLESGDVTFDKLLKHFEKSDFELLTSTEISFKCACSRDRMVQGIASLTRSEGIDGIFLDKDSIETKCDYCKTHYLITKEEILTSLTQ